MPDNVGWSLPREWLARRLIPDRLRVMPRHERGDAWKIIERPDGLFALWWNSPDTGGHWDTVTLDYLRRAGQ